MALILNEEQQMLRDSAKSFITESSPVSSLRSGAIVARNGRPSFGRVWPRWAGLAW